MELRSKICPCFLLICILCVYIFCRDHNWITNKVEVKCYPNSRLIDIFLLLLWLNELLRKNCCTPLSQIYNSDNEVTGLVEEPAYIVVISEHLNRDYQLSLHKNKEKTNRTQYVMYVLRRTIPHLTFQSRVLNCSIYMPRKALRNWQFN